MNFGLAIIFGIGFGYILQRVGAFEFENIINALRLKDLMIPKFMLFSVAITALGVFSLHGAGLVSLDLIAANPIAAITGGLIFGIGFALTGYCPGTSIGAMGEGKKDARYVVYGGLIGVLTFSLIQQFLGFSASAFDLGKISLIDLIPLDPFSTAILYSVSLVGVIFLVDLWEQKMKNKRGNFNHV